MKFYITIILIFLLTKVALTQNSKIDSLDKLVSKATSDTAKINLLIKKNQLIGRINIDSGIMLYKETIRQSQSIKYPIGEANARVNLAFQYSVKGAYITAAENLAISEKIYLNSKDSAGLCNLYSGYGTMYGMQSKYDTSIQFLEKAVVIAERNKLENLLGSFYGNIAIGYQMQSSFLQALQYQQKALDLAKAKGDIALQAYTNVNMGISFINMEDTVRAGQCLLEAVRLAKTENIKNAELYAYSNLAGLYSRMKKFELAYAYGMKAARLGAEMGDDGIRAASLSKAAEALGSMLKFKEAEALAKQAIVVADSSGQPFNIYQVNATMGTVLQQQAKYNAAIPFLEKSIALSGNTDQYDEALGSVHFRLADCYEKTGNFSKALAMYQLASKIKDSIRSRENIRKATELNMNYEFNKKEEAQRIEQKNRDAITRTRQLALLIGLGLTLVLALVAYSGYRNKQKANKQLQAQKEEIENTLIKLQQTQAQLIQSEKMASLGELTAGIAHEIQNPLNFVNNFSELNTELIEELKEEFATGNGQEAMMIADDIKENGQKINHHGKRADAIVKGMLQHSRNSSGKKEPTDVNVLADEYLRLAYHGLRAKDKSFNAAFKTDFDESIGKINVVPQDIGRVFLNLFNNAFYAVNQKKKLAANGYEPNVVISTKNESGNIVIQVYDNGPGIPKAVLDKIYQPFFTTKPTGEGTGLGLSLSYDIITKTHNGRLEVTSEEGEFTAFTITLPVS